MNADDILDRLRPVVMVVDSIGTIQSVRGGYGGFFGHAVADLEGASVFDFVPPTNVDDLATYFIESGDQSLDTVSLPLPFRVSLIGTDGLEHPVDVIPAARDDDGEHVGWVVLVVPVALQTSVSRSLEVEMSGAPRDKVKRTLTEELAVDNQHYSSRWFLVDLTSATPTVTTSRREEQRMATAIRDEVVDGGWRPWVDIRAGETAAMDADDLPDALSAIARSRSWRRVSVTPVHLDGIPVAAYVLVGRVPADYDVSQVNANVLARIQLLVDATSLLMARWRDRDRLVEAATRDPLTGLANRDAFADAMAGAGDLATLLYIDVDHFKSVNDRYGHEVGDRVLVEIGRRIVHACRPTDTVARFGGDEFVVLLDGVDAEHAQQVGERIVELVGAPMIEVDGLHPVTVSVGLAVLVSSDDVIDAADRAMLQAKRSGRGRLVSAPPTSAPDDELLPRSEAG